MKNKLTKRLAAKVKPAKKFVTAYAALHDAMRQETGGKSKTRQNQLRQLWGRAASEAQTTAEARSARDFYPYTHLPRRAS